jgi:YfiH family protein
LFTDRRGGLSRPPYDEDNLATHVGDDPETVARNRAALAVRIGAPIVWMEQAHGSAIAVVDGPEPEPVAAVDGLVTRRRNLALGVLVADCVPVLLADIDAGVIAAAHVGRRGLAAGTVLHAVDIAGSVGATSARLQAWLGPSICPRCYELPAELRAEVDAAAPGSASTTRGGLPSVDLRGGLRRQLLRAGLRAVRDVGPCTAESADHYSHRRDGVTGRFAGVVVLSTRSDDRA